MKISEKITTLFIGLLLCASNTYANDAAMKLNQDWKNINRTGCKSGEPDYYCSGVIAHVFDHHDSSNNPWMPSTASITNGFVSFSYLRQDISGNNPLFWVSTTAGYIFSPIADLITDSRQYTLLCEYPIDAFSDYRTNQGCGYDPQYSPDFIVGCSKAGVNTADEYLNNVKTPAPVCSASPDQAGFKMMLETIKKLKTDDLDSSYRPGWNELIIQEWSSKKNEDVPIEAFFYQIKNDIPDMAGKAAADSAAQLYHIATGIDVPVVAVDINKLESKNDAPFSNETQ